MNVYTMFQTETGNYRLVVSDENQFVKDIFEGSFRQMMEQLLKAQDPNTNLRIRVDNRKTK